MVQRKEKNVLAKCIQIQHENINVCTRTAAKVHTQHKKSTRHASDQRVEGDRREQNRRKRERRGWGGKGGQSGWESK